MTVTSVDSVGMLILSLHMTAKNNLERLADKAEPTKNGYLFLFSLLRVFGRFNWQLSVFHEKYYKQQDGAVLT